MRPTTAELASRCAARWRHLMSHNFGSNEQMFGAINKSQTGVEATKKRIRQNKR
jgi:hypothetical protein